MARRHDPTRVLVAQVLGAVEHGDPAAELVVVAKGRRDVLEVLAERRDTHERG